MKAWQPPGNHPATQYSIGKDSIGQLREEEYSASDSDESDQPTTPKPKKEKSKAEKETEALTLKVCELLGKYDYSLFTEGTPELQKAIVSFVEFRKGIKKPMTDHAIDLLIQKLKGMSTSPKVQVEIINQSIMNGWQGIFPLKEQQQTFGQRTKPVNGRRHEAEAVDKWLERSANPPKTAGEDESVRARAEALKKELAGDYL